MSIDSFPDKGEEDSCRICQLKGLLKVQKGHKSWLVVNTAEDISNAFRSTYPFLVSIEMQMKWPYSVFESFQDSFLAVLPRQDVRAIGLGF